MNGYYTSKDYKLLWKEINRGVRVPGWIENPKWSKPYPKDIVEIKMRENKSYMMGVRGIGYEGFKNDKDSFMENCEYYNLEFIVPHP